MKDPKSIHPESVAAFSRGAPQAALDAAPARRPSPARGRLVAALAALGLALALAALAMLRGEPAALTSGPAPTAVPTLPPGPTLAPTAAAKPAEQLALGWAPGGRDVPIPAGAAFERLGPTEWVGGATECYVEARYEDASGPQAPRVWGPCAMLGFADAPAPTAAPAAPPRPQAPQAPAPVVVRPQAPVAAPAAAPPPPVVEGPASDLVPIPAEGTMVEVVNQPGHYDAVLVQPPQATPVPTPRMGNMNGGGGSWGGQP